MGRWEKGDRRYVLGYSDEDTENWEVFADGEWKFNLKPVVAHRRVNLYPRM